MLNSETWAQWSSLVWRRWTSRCCPHSSDLRGSYPAASCREGWASHSTPLCVCVSGWLCSLLYLPPAPYETKHDPVTPESSFESKISNETLYQCRRGQSFCWGVWSTCWLPAPHPWCPSLWRPGLTPPGWARWLSEGHLYRLPSDQSHLKHNPKVMPFRLFTLNSHSDVKEIYGSLL